MTAIPFRICPGCGKPSTGFTAKGSVRYVCGSCYRAALSELALRLILERPASAEERYASFPELVKGSHLEKQEPCERPPKPPRKVAARTGPTVAQRVLDYLKASDRPLHAKSIDRGARLRKGSTLRTVQTLVDARYVAPVRKGSRTLWSTAQEDLLRYFS